MNTVECINGKQRPRKNLACVQDDVNQHILCMLQGTFSLGTTHKSSDSYHNWAIGVLEYIYMYLKP